MEDEFGYMFMTPQVKKVNPTPPPRRQGSPPSLVGYKIAVVMLGAVCVLLTAAVIAQNIWGFRAGGTRCSSESNHRQEASMSQLMQSLCDLAQSSPAGGTGCILCPKDWWENRAKCYWGSNESQFWNESRQACKQKNSQMLVIQDQEEMDFIQSLTKGTGHFWIGLNFTARTNTWSWVDGSPLNRTLFTVWGPDAHDGCGVVKGKQIYADTCSAEFRWICQKAAVVLRGD
ncbi:killer cell lectin-like receptor subfamily F member 1 [Pelodiscus sinensis]|uniref:killer cell lectin-like receptor subfamily F member 1 n=1 Tax=Pelodiscus sinensis TaxID=13735 RepID=UPI003F6D7CB7